MRSFRPFPPVALLAFAALSTLASLAMMIGSAWVAVAAGEPELAAAGDRRWWTWAGVTAVALVASLWAAHRRRVAARAARVEDEPILWI